jgi:hypothetical protein
MKALWLRLTLQNRAPDVTLLTYLEVGYPPLDDIRLFWKQGMVSGTAHRNGDSVPHFMPAR